MSGRLRAALVIARRDFAAIIFSRAFFFFLLGPLFPVVIGVVAGGLGRQVAADADRPVLAVALPQAEQERLASARLYLADRLGDRALPELRAIAGAQVDDPARLLRDGAEGDRFVAVLSGTLAVPRLAATAGDLDRWSGPMRLLIERARLGSAGQTTQLATQAVTVSAGSREVARLVTAQAGQVVLFLLTMLLAGMVLSNLVEEKTNKIIEILAAAVPVDAIFFGKLLAMLAMALVGIGLWCTAGLVTIGLAGSALPPLPSPAVGWPLFLVLGFLYFATGYLLLGSLFLGIGAMAATVREVQTLSMPVTMLQLVNFFLATYAVTKMGEPVELFTAIFPFSSPFAMLARAAQQDAVWPHLLALGWQALWVMVIVRLGALMFRRNVMKSGRTRRRRVSGAAR